MEKKSRWYDLWNITFQGKLYPSEYDMIEQNLLVDKVTKIKGLKESEIEQAIRTLDKTGTWEKKTPRLKHLRAVIFANRNNEVNTVEQVIKRAMGKLEAENDPAMRWAICCEACDGAKVPLFDQADITEKLAQFAGRLPGGLKRAGVSFRRTAETIAHNLAGKFAIGGG